MSFLRSVGAIAAASGEGSIDWDAVAEAAKGATDPGSLDLEPGEREGYVTDIRDARRAVHGASGLAFGLPGAAEIQNRHHWIDANVSTFGAIMAPLEDRPVVLPGLTRRINSATMATFLSFLAGHVLGQYDPLLLADDDEHGLYFVRPNIRRVASELDVDYDRFRRWIAVHEVTHAAEFGAAPWLSAHLEASLEEAVGALADGELPTAAFREIDTGMTVVEGYAEFVMDRAVDDSYTDIREKVDARRRSGGPLTWILRRVFGLGLKRRQYERGKAFFEAVAEIDEGAVPIVWQSPEHLPRDEELDAPARWVRRVR